MSKTFSSKSYLAPMVAVGWLIVILATSLEVEAAANEKKQADPKRPHIVLVMTDDQGWGQTGYNGHPLLKTPNLDSMANNGLRFDRFYAAGPVCSPTRASVLTGRTHRRTGVESHGYALRLQEKTISQALQQIGYATGHFGKWHLNGLRGPGVPIFADDSHRPGVFGFDTWLSVTNFYDRNPLLSRVGVFEEFTGDSSEIAVDEALKFIRQHADQPTFTVIWFGTPHVPFMAAEGDTQHFEHLDDASRDHYGELVAMDRSIGTLRKGLKEIGIADNTMVWFTSDNGGLPKVKPETVGGLRGFKGQLYEGGIRVPAIIEWPAEIKHRVTQYPAFACDIAPTIAEIIKLKSEALLAGDGLSLKTLLHQEIGKREKAIPFSYQNNFAMIDYNYKLLQLTPKPKKNQPRKPKTRYELYDLGNDPTESNNLFETKKELAEKLKDNLDEFKNSLQRSIAGKDYPEGEVNAGEPEPRHWSEVQQYQPYFETWKQRPEYGSWLKKQKK